MRSTIPGNRISESRIWSDTTLEWLQAERTRLVRGQKPTMRSNARYVAYLNRLDRAILARKEA